jgi:CheY-like chemotaxis protein
MKSTVVSNPRKTSLALLSPLSAREVPSLQSPLGAGKADGGAGDPLKATDPLNESDGEHMRKRVLIVDDEAAILFGFKKIIQGSGVDVDTAETIEEAVDLLTSRNYQFVITDLKLSGSPGEDGFEVIKRAKEKESHTKVILITGYGTPEVMERALAIGAEYYYEKPVSATVLRDALKRLGM